MKISDKFDSIECRQDTKARRVLNAAPELAATITAEQLETGVTLEQLEALNVPVFRYATQITIHGRLPDFNASSRPAGYKAVFLNQNGSVGVRYSAIDAPKKLLLVRACRAAKSVWKANNTSLGLEIGQTFSVRNENDREAAKAAALAALRSVPVSLFFGQAFAYALPFRAGYGVGVFVGAIPAAELFPLIAFFSKIESEPQLVALEAQNKLERDASDAEHFAAFAKIRADYQVFVKASFDALYPSLKPLTSAPLDGVVFIQSTTGFLRVALEMRRGRLFYTIEERDFKPTYDSRKLAENGFPWRLDLAAGRVFKSIG